MESRTESKKIKKRKECSTIEKRYVKEKGRMRTWRTVREGQKRLREGKGAARIIL